MPSIKYRSGPFQQLQQPLLLLLKNSQRIIRNTRFFGLRAHLDVSTAPTILQQRMMIIVNPQAGHGRALAYLDHLPRWLRKSRLDARIEVTQGPGDATLLARAAVMDGYRRLVVMGGDGTFREAVDGVCGQEVELGLIPVGTGNDLARTLGLPINRPKKALEVLRRWHVRRIDVGKEGAKCFLSVLGIGYPALVAEETNQLRWLKGPPSFFLSVYKGLLKMGAAQVQMILDEQEVEIGCTSILIHNTPYTGGGLKIAPMARIDDGYFDIVVIGAIGRLDLMWNFPKVYRGTHLDHPSFHHFRSRSVAISGDQSIRKMRDGDPAGALPLQAEVVPGALRVVIPGPRNGPGDS